MSRTRALQRQQQQLFGVLSVLRRTVSDHKLRNEPHTLFVGWVQAGICNNVQGSSTTHGALTLTQQPILQSCAASCRPYHGVTQEHMLLSAGQQHSCQKGHHTYHGGCDRKDAPCPGLVHADGVALVRLNKVQHHRPRALGETLQCTSNTPAGRALMPLCQEYICPLAGNNELLQ
jgi:hypothetical protein